MSELPEAARCTATTKKGDQCRNPATSAGGTCARHSITTPIAGSQKSEGKHDQLIFKDGLYYPFIDIQDEALLKTAALYWDSVSTIVPDMYDGHRHSEASRILTSEGFLKAEIVAPGMWQIEETADECLTYLDSAEGRTLLEARERRPRPLPDEIMWHPEAIHHRKLAERLLPELARRGLRFEDRGHWARVPGWFARFYMTLLATRIARQVGCSLLTDDLAAEPLANRAVRGDASQEVPRDLAEGLLATLVLRTIHVNEGVSIQKLLQFKSKHANELGRLRTALRELVNPIKGDTDLALLRKHLDTVHTDRVLPAIEEIRGRLKDNRISCGYNNLKASTLLSASPSAIGAVLSTLGLAPFGLVGGVGISLLLSLGNYQLQRSDLLRNSPYSYVIRAEESFGVNPR